MPPGSEDVELSSDKDLEHSSSQVLTDNAVGELEAPMESTTRRDAEDVTVLPEVAPRLNIRDSAVVDEGYVEVVRTPEAPWGNDAEGNTRALSSPLPQRPSDSPTREAFSLLTIEMCRIVSWGW